MNYLKQSKYIREKREKEREMAAGEGTIGKSNWYKEVYCQEDNTDVDSAEFSVTIFFKMRLKRAKSM